MIKIILCLFLILSSSPVFALTSNRIPLSQTSSSPGISSIEEDSDIIDILGNSLILGVPTTIDSSLLIYNPSSNAGITIFDGTVEGIIFDTSSSSMTVGTQNNYPLNFYVNNTQQLTISNGDVYTNAWADYSGSSTIVGFSSFSSKYIYTSKVGKDVFVNFNLSGTSNASSITFTLPYAASSSQGDTTNIVVAITNSTQTSGLIITANNSTTVTCYPTVSGGNWTNGTSTCEGQFQYHSS